MCIPQLNKRSSLLRGAVLATFAHHGCRRKPGAIVSMADPISDLPGDARRLVFAHLPLKSLLSCEAVSKQLHTAAVEDEVWQWLRGRVSLLKQFLKIG